MIGKEKSEKKRKGTDLNREKKRLAESEIRIPLCIVVVPKQAEGFLFFPCLQPVVKRYRDILFYFI